jgi:phage-related protein
MPVNCNQAITLTNLCVTPEAKKSVSFRTLQQQYGDGYMARRQDGLNPVNYTWDVSTPLMPIDEALAFENELIANGTGFFNWTPPDRSSEETFILDPVEWEWTWGSDSMASINFTLKRWYS